MIIKQFLYISPPLIKIKLYIFGLFFFLPFEHLSLISAFTVPRDKFLNSRNRIFVRRMRNMTESACLCNWFILQFVFQYTSVGFGFLISSGSKNSYIHELIFQWKKNFYLYSGSRIDQESKHAYWIVIHSSFTI